jgi:NAD(P)-dependent dehydrogenase (short-subunit alcohol dehydrogenase family)
MTVTTPNELFDLTGRVAIVTGGTRGIGLAIAKGFGAAGASIVIASRKPDACDATADVLTALGVETVGVAANLANLDDVRRIVEAAHDRFGGIDIIVNNAANAVAQPIGSITPEAFAKSIDVNLRGPLFLVQEALSFLRASEHASVINVLSGAAYLFSPDLTLYAAAKAGLASVTRSMAAAFAGDAIRVNGLSPGTTDTDMVRATSADDQAAMVSTQLLQRMAAPDELVGAALLLASDAGSFITGQVLFVDGGAVPR